MDIPSDLIAEIYEAAPDPDGLERMSQLVRRALDIDSAGFWLIRDGAIVEIASTPDIRASEPAYLARYHALDPWTDRDPNRVGLVTLGSELFDERELVKTEFYNDFARHYGMFRPMGATLPLGEGTMASVAANRIAPGRLLDESDRLRMQSLVVHLRSALRIRLRFAALQEVATIRDEALQALAFPLVISDGGGRVAFVNEAARESCKRSGPLTIRGTAIEAARAEDRTGFHAAIRRAATGEATSIGLQDRAGQLVPASVAPASPRVSGTQGNVLISLPPTRPTDVDSVLRQAFGLTSAQAQLCRSLVAGQTFEQAASTRGVAVSTMRSHFKVVLERTGTANLRDLLRLLGSLPQLRPSSP